MRPFPAVVAAIAPGDAAGLDAAIARAGHLGFSAVLVPVPADAIEAARRDFAGTAERSAMPVALLVDDADPTTTIHLAAGMISVVSRHAADLVIGRAPQDPDAHLAAFGRLAGGIGERVPGGTGLRPADRAVGRVAAWDGLDRIAPALAAVLERDAETRAALRSDPCPTGDYALVTGGAGFIGCNLADRLLASGDEHVLLLDSLQRPGVERNLRWLRARHGDRVHVRIADLRDETTVEEAVRGATSVFHLAAQVAVTTSLVDPRADFAINVGGTLTLLDAVRRLRPEAPFVFASTNKVYGDLADVALALEGDAWHPTDPAIRENGIGETRALDFHTPYGCSKGAADQYVLDYARSFGLRAVVLRMSCIYGRLQLGTEDQGWVAHFLRAARAGETITLFGDGHQVRDILDVDDAVSAYVAARSRAAALRGRAFNLGGGPANAVSLHAVLDEIGALLGRNVERRFAGWRQGDQRYFVTDRRQAGAALGLATPLPWVDGLARLARWMDDTASAEPGRAARPARREADALA